MADKDIPWYDRPFNDETDEAKAKRLAREEKARQDEEFTLKAMRFPGGPAKSDDSSPDTEEAMNKHFSEEDKKREREANESIGNARYRQTLAAQQKAIHDQAQLKMGGFKEDRAMKNRVTIGSGASGIIAGAGANYAPKLGIGAGVEEIKAVMDMSNAMQAHRRAVKEYERREREKKKNDGGLTSARQNHSVPTFFPDLPMLKVGGVTFKTMQFDGVRPIVNTFQAGRNGAPMNNDMSTDRNALSAARAWRSGHI
jgi:hypothetical protein